MSSNKTTSHIADMPAAAFTALAQLNIYHFADLAWKGVDKASRRRERLRTLHQHGILHELNDPEDGDAIHRRYCQAIEDHVQNTFPDDWEPTYDYWSAKCISHKPGWKAPKNNTYFAGDSGFRYMAFAGTEALHEYTEESLQEIQAAIDAAADACFEDDYEENAA